MKKKRKLRPSCGVAEQIVCFLRSFYPKSATLDSDMAKTFHCTPPALYYAVNKLQKTGVIIGSSAKNSHRKTFAVASDYISGDEWMIAAGCNRQRKTAGELVQLVQTPPKEAISAVSEPTPPEPTQSSPEPPAPTAPVSGISLPLLSEIFKTSGELKKAVEEVVEENTELAQKLKGSEEKANFLISELEKLLGEMKLILSLVKEKEEK